MSVESIALALHHSRATGTAKLVLIGIANHDGDGGAWPSIETLALYANVKDRRRVKRILRELEALGEIRTLPQMGGFAEMRADRRPNRYEILVRCPAGCDRTPQHRCDGVVEGPPGQDHGVVDTLLRGGREEQNGVVEGPPEPSLEPPKNTAPPHGAPLTRRTDPRSDAVTRSWWDEQTPKPLQNYVAVRGIVDKALKAGHEPGAVTVALHIAGADPPVVTWKLEKALAAGRPKRRDPRGLNGDRDGR